MEPCNNQAVCKQEGDTYKCECLFGTGGENCQDGKTPIYLFLMPKGTK